jgi:four helix bundle protein
MNQNDKAQFNEQLRERTMRMAVDVRNLLCALKISAIDRPLVNQLIRSSSSVAANYRSATRGRSDAEFYSKLCVVVEECDETKFWLDYLVRLNVLNESETTALRDEAEQLVRLFASIKRTMKIKIEKNGKVLNLKSDV